jgi:hypothetical protein
MMTTMATGNDENDDGDSATGDNDDDDCKVRPEKKRR